MKMKSLYGGILLLGALMLNSCGKDKNPEPDNKPPVVGTEYKKGTVQIQFTNTVGAEALKTDGTEYTNPHGEVFSVSNFLYYITNVQLVKEDGTKVSIPDSYYLIDQNTAGSGKITLPNTLGGKYKAVSFLIGVDSTRNVSGVQEGALDAKHGMFWSWSTGYIMLKLEGASPASTSAGNRIFYHAGGFSGMANALRNVTLNFPETKVLDGGQLSINLQSDILKIFSGVNDIKIADLSVVMSAGANSNKLASNYQNMISIQSVETK